MINRNGNEVKKEYMYIVFPGGTSDNPPANAGDIRDIGSIPGSGRSPEGDSLQGCAQHKCMETHSSILAGESNGQRSLVGYSP